MDHWIPSLCWNHTFTSALCVQKQQTWNLYMGISNFSLSFSLWNWLHVSGAFSLITKRSSAARSPFSYLSVSVAMRYERNLSFYFLQFSAKFPLKVIFPGGFNWSIFFSFPPSFLFFFFFSYFFFLWHCIMCLSKGEERGGEQSLLFRWHKSFLVLTLLLGLLLGYPVQLCISSVL